MASSVASAGFVTSVPLRSLRCVRCVGWKPRLSDRLQNWRTVNEKSNV